MDKAPPEIQHISDTALWVAHFRAEEALRPNPLFKDPLSGMLAGERGRGIAQNMPYGKIIRWVMAIRTVAIDRLILRAISEGADTVINLGAGLDTRPYRMQLPATLRWVEVDFPAIIDFKSEKLKNEKPVCKLERVSQDLSDKQARRELFARLGRESKSAVLITEGVIAYLSTEDAEALSRDLLAIPSFRFWIQDYHRGGTRRWGRRMNRSLKSSPLRFESTDPIAFFSSHGWKVHQNIPSGEEAIRAKRPFPFIFPWTLFRWISPPSVRRKWDQMTGYIMYIKDASH